MPAGKLKKGDLLVVSRVPGFEAELHSSWLRLSDSGQAWYWSRRFLSPGGGESTQRLKHVFNASVLRRIRGLLQGLPPQGRPGAIMDDAAWRTLHFWENGQERSLSFQEQLFDEAWCAKYGAGYGAPYPAMPRLRALWALLHFPFEKP